MIMAFKSDKQRKAFFAQKNNPRSSISPSFVRSSRPMLTSTQKTFISKEIRRQRKEGKPIKQSIAIAFSKARTKFPSQKALKLKGNPNNNPTKKELTNLLILLFGTTVALQILRQARTG